MTEIQRIHVPANPPARIQKAIPKPYQRPSINAGHPVEKRAWRNTLACDLAIGDIVPGVGRVHLIVEGVPHYTRLHGLTDAVRTSEWTITVTGGVDNVRSFKGEELVLAFVIQP